MKATEIKQQFLKTSPITMRFSLPLPKAQVVEMLKGAVMAETERRHRKFQEGQELTRQIDEMAEWLTNPQGKFCMILFGKPGNGKTTLVKALQEVLRMLKIRNTEDNSTYCFRIWSAREIAWMCKDDYKNWASLCRLNMLAIDDLGTEPSVIQDYGNHLSPIVDMLYKRYDEQLFTIITTNLMPGDITGKYGERIADRLNEVACRIVFTNTSYRTIP